MIKMVGDVSTSLDMTNGSWMGRHLRQFLCD